MCIVAIAHDSIVAWNYIGLYQCCEKCDFFQFDLCCIIRSLMWFNKEKWQENITIYEEYDLNTLLLILYCKSGQMYSMATYLDSILQILPPLMIVMLHASNWIKQSYFQLFEHEELNNDIFKKLISRKMNRV